MVRLLVLAAVAVVLAGSLLTPRFARSVSACSAGPDYNPVADSDVIVAGTVLGWERGGSGALPSPPSGFPFVPIRVALRVEQHFKGSTAAEIVISDQSSLHGQLGQSGWGAARALAARSTRIPRGCTP